MKKGKVKTLRVKAVNFVSVGKKNGLTVNSSGIYSPEQVLNLETGNFHPGFEFDLEENEALALAKIKAVVLLNKTLQKEQEIEHDKEKVENSPLIPTKVHVDADTDENRESVDGVSSLEKSLGF